MQIYFLKRMVRVSLSVNSVKPCFIFKNFVFSLASSYLPIFFLIISFYCVGTYIRCLSSSRPGGP